MNNKQLLEKYMRQNDQLRKDIILVCFLISCAAKYRATENDLIEMHPNDLKTSNKILAKWDGKEVNNE